LDGAAPETAAQIHNANQLGPLTISPLWCKPGSGKASVFEVAVLADWLVEPLIAGVEASPIEIRLGPQPFSLTGWEVSTAATWHDLLAPAPAGWRQFECELKTPTAHHQRQPFRKSIVLPSPELYVGSWLERWNLCCEIKLDADALRQVVEERVAISAASGATRSVLLDPGRPFIGFEGRVRFVLLEPETFSEPARNSLAALARFANFAGTGVETMRGMGQTRCPNF
jgi:CRISPR/Cas system endoribonuclease Cas6 (RAMP superfamily)